LTITSTTTIFTEIYGENVGIAGTNFIAQGLGFLLMAQIQGRLMDVFYRRMKKHYNSDGKPEFRLPLSESIAAARRTSSDLFDLYQ
jgi:hypothetical protein